MKREFLEKNAKLLGEVDFEEENSDIYAGTKYFYWYNDSLYVSEQHRNLNSYTGRSETTFLGNKEYLKEQLTTTCYQFIPAFMGACSDDIVKSICEMCEVEYREDNYF